MLNLSHYNNNVKEAFKQINLSMEFRKLGVAELKNVPTKYFPLLQSWPYDLTSDMKKLDLTSSVFNWIKENIENVEFRELVAKAVHPKVNCLKSSLSLKKLYREYCDKHGLVYAF
jgi:hypothetical protein